MFLNDPLGKYLVEVLRDYVDHGVRGVESVLERIEAYVEPADYILECINTVLRWIQATAGIRVERDDLSWLISLLREHQETLIAIDVLLDAVDDGDMDMSAVDQAIAYLATRLKAKTVDFMEHLKSMAQKSDAA